MDTTWDHATIQGTVASIDLPAASFDAAFLIHVLEPLDDPVAVLRRIGTRIYPDRCASVFLACTEMSDGTTP